MNDGVYEFLFYKYDTGSDIIHNYRDDKNNQKWITNRDQSTKDEKYHIIMNMKGKLFLTA